MKLPISYQIKVVRCERAMETPVKVQSPQESLAYWRTNIATSQAFQEDKEHLVVLTLNTRYGIKGWTLVSMGSVNESIAHPREIFRPEEARCREARETMYQRLAAPLSGTAGDLTADLFNEGQTPLFNERRSK